MVSAGLTPRSSGAPPACKQARSAVRSIFRSPGLLASRRRPLSSNVRPHEMPTPPAARMPQIQSPQIPLSCSSRPRRARQSTSCSGSQLSHQLHVLDFSQGWHERKRTVRSQGRAAPASHRVSVLCPVPVSWAISTSTSQFRVVALLAIKSQFCSPCRTEFTEPKCIKCKSRWPKL